MPKTNATFIEPMLLLRTDNLPQGADWLYEMLDGYRALAIKSGGKVQLRSRNDNDFTERYSSIAAALCTVPDETILDGELIALDEEGRPSFHRLQNYVSSKAALVFFIFDVLILRGRNVMREPLSERRALSGKARPSRPRGADPLLPGVESRPSPTDCFGQISRAIRAGRETPQQPL